MRPPGPGQNASPAPGPKLAAKIGPPCKKSEEGELVENACVHLKEESTLPVPVEKYS